MVPLPVSSPGILAGPEIGNPIPVLAASPRPATTRLSPSRSPSWPLPRVLPLWRRPQADHDPAPVHHLQVVRIDEHPAASCNHLTTARGEF